MIYVATQFPLAIQDVDGSVIRIEGTTSRLLVPIPESAYRLNAWMGLFRRRLVRARGFGREFWIDDVWRRMHRPKVGPRIVESPKLRNSGCGCGRKR